jgi:hypothetical protein
MAYRITNLSVDSRFADQFYDGTGEFMIRTPSIMRNVCRVAVSSVEIPQVAYVFSERCGNTEFFFDICGVRHTGSIASGNYTPAELAAAVADAFDIGGVDVSWNSITNRFTIRNTGTFPFALTLAATYSSRARYWGLGYWMGFRVQTLFVGAGSSVVAPSSPVTDPPAYALLQLQCPDMVESTLHRIESGSYVQALAKVVLRYGVYQIQFDDGGNDLRKENAYPSPTAISQLRFRLVDAYGVTVDMGDTDWSLTLEVTEVVSSIAK